MSDKPVLTLEELNVRYEDDKPEYYAYRSRVPGGWLIFIHTPGKGGLCGTSFYPDPNHEWDGGSLQS